jgi:hypothetical protein
MTGAAVAAVTKAMYKIWLTSIVGRKESILGDERSEYFATISVLWNFCVFK